jgi:hypothetical protein
MALIRSLADASAMFERLAPCVMLPVAATCRNKRKSVKSNLIDIFEPLVREPSAKPEGRLAPSALFVCPGRRKLVRASRKVLTALKQPKDNHDRQH